MYANKEAVQRCEITASDVVFCSNGPVITDEKTSSIIVSIFLSCICFCVVFIVCHVIFSALSAQPET